MPTIKIKITAKKCYKFSSHKLNDIQIRRYKEMLIVPLIMFKIFEFVMVSLHGSAYHSLCERGDPAINLTIITELFICFFFLRAHKLLS